MGNATPQRISVVGVSGSGKTTTAKAIASRLEVPHLELDSVFHLANWEPRDSETFQAIVSEFVAQDEWVVDGNYAAQGILDIVWERADTVVWLDLPRRKVMRQMISRSLRRAFTAEELWNGNTEPSRNLLRWDPEDNIVRWAWTQYKPLKERYTVRTHDPQWGHCDIVRMQSAMQISNYVSGLQSS
ncbi:MAG: hypothetical protein ACR2N7_11730 [Acidimicrobiia bacterium]